MTKEEIIEYRKEKAPFEGDSGLPTLKGKGPARDVSGLIIEYRKENPDATWKELFANVANHYASWQSMKRALASLFQSGVTND